VRIRALLFLLVLTAGDYLLWNWSIDQGHDVVSLVAGLTLLPLAAVSLGALAMAGARLMGWLLGRSSSAFARPRRAARDEDQHKRAQPTATAESESSPSRLAA
jgi:hypothetical protein